MCTIMLCISRLVLQCNVELWCITNCISLHACLMRLDTGQQEGSSCACRPWLAIIASNNFRILSRTYVSLVCILLVQLS